jgi:hypothetical protein
MGHKLQSATKRRQFDAHKKPASGRQVNNGAESINKFNATALETPPQTTKFLLKQTRTEHFLFGRVRASWALIKSSIVMK